MNNTHSVKNSAVTPRAAPVNWPEITIYDPLAQKESLLSRVSRSIVDSSLRQY